METFLSVFEHTAGITAGILVGLVVPVLAVLFFTGILGSFVTLVLKFFKR